MAMVLVVDDRTTNRELVRTLLGYRGHHVIEAPEGHEALSLAHSEHPDLVLTDILMPGMDGYQLARELRTAPDTAHTPIVFYTANYQLDEIRPFAEACGVARVLLKSADPQVLMDAIDEVLAEKRPADGPIDVTEADREHLQAVSAKLFEKSESLDHSETRFQLMADASPVGIVFGDALGSANYVNTRLTEIMGVPAGDLLGLGWLRCTGAESHAEIHATVRRVAGEGDHHFRGEVALRNGDKRWLAVRVQAVEDDAEGVSGFIATVDDVTAVVEADERRRADERRHDIETRDRATARLESLGRLAGGVAHDYNNIVGVISAYEGLVSESITALIAAEQLEAEVGQVLLGDLERIRQGGRRLTGLTKQLLAFGSRTTISLTALDFNQAVRESNDLIGPTLGSGVRLVTQLAPDLRQVLAEPTNVAQILLNLTVNSGHAMPDGGTLTVVTSNLDVAGDEGGPARFVRLTVRDTGHGMAPEVLERAIEPFFTTKPQGKGTGFGLATVYGIVNQLGGNLDIESAPGRGTLVTVDLPAADEPVDTRPPAPAQGGRAETILVAEDEEGIRDIVAKRLSAAGYQVLAAEDGPAALRLADLHPEPIDLLLSDVMMPGMRGDELAARLIGRRPGTRVLFMSGYPGGLLDRQGALDPGVTVLPKPFTKVELLTAVREKLASSAAA